MRFAFLVTIPAVVGLLVLVKPVVITLFYNGEFNLNDVNFTCLAMVGYLVSLFCLIFVRIITSALYIQNKIKLVFWASLICLIFFIVLNSCIITFYNQDKFAFVYLATANSVVVLINMILQLLILTKFNPVFLVEIFLPFKYLCKIVIACICMAVVLNLFNLGSNYWVNLTMSNRFINMSMIILIGFISYMVVLFALGVRKDICVS